MAPMAHTRVHSKPAVLMSPPALTLPSFVDRGEHPEAYLKACYDRLVAGRDSTKKELEIFQVGARGCCCGRCKSVASQC